MRVKVTTLDDNMTPTLFAYVWVEDGKVKVLTWNCKDKGPSFLEELNSGVYSAPQNLDQSIR